MSWIGQFVQRATPRWVTVAAGRARSGGRQRLAARQIGPVVNQVVPGATTHELLVLRSDAAVVRVERHDDEPVILKLATSAGSVEFLDYQVAALEELAQLNSLGHWRRLVATLEQRGTYDGGSWFTQSVIPGEPVTNVEVDPDALVAEAVRALRPFHVATESTVMADESVLDDLVTKPIEMLRSWRPGLEGGLTAINGECRQRLASLELCLCRQHGAYVPSNILWDRDAGVVSGITDWRMPMQLLPAEVEYVHFALSLLANRRRVDYGEAVILMLNDGSGVVAGDPVEHANELGPNQFDVRTAVALTWLHHMSFDIHNRAELRTNPIWLEKNIDSVVRVLDAK